MFSNSRRIELIRRLQVLTKEMEEITQILNDNPCPITDEDIDRGVRALLNQNACIVLSSLERQMHDGLPSTTLATYYPNATSDKKLKSYARETNAEALLVFQRLIDIGQYTIVKGDEDAAAYCLQLEFPGHGGNGKRVVVVDKEPSQPLVQIGPKRQIRQKVGDETLELHLEQTNVTREDLERAVKERQQAMRDEDVVWFYVDITEQQKGDKSTG